MDVSGALATGSTAPTQHRFQKGTTMTRLAMVGLVAVAAPTACSNGPCPRGQEFREERYPLGTKVKARGSIRRLTPHYESAAGTTAASGGLPGLAWLAGASKTGSAASRLSEASNCGGGRFAGNASGCVSVTADDTSKLRES